MSSSSERSLRRRRLRRRMAGTCLFVVVVFGSLSALRTDVPALAAGLPAWIAGVLLWPDLPRRTRRQGIVLLTAGMTGLAWGWTRGVVSSWAHVLAGNATLIAMLAAVSFLRLITAPGAEEDPAPPSGPGAVRSTIVGLHLFGAVVNLSTIFIMARRMAPDGRLDSRQVRLLIRGFSAAAFWSPFFAAMAAALTYAPGAKLSHLVAVGVPLALVALLVTVREVEREDAGSFRGYPMSLRSLWLPMLLAAIILGLHAVRPQLSILGLIAALAPAVTVATLAVRREPVLRRTVQQITHGLPLMASELVLFLAAGVMAAGLESTIATTGGWLPFHGFGGMHAALLLAVLVGLAVTGVHPVISIAAASSLLAPLAPDPTLLAMTFIVAWGIGVAVSPLSGLTLAIQGAYGIRGMDILRWNARYGMTMVIAAGLAFTLYARVAGI